jgi:putative chitinase
MDLTKLKGHVPDSVIAQIPEVAAKFGVNTPLRLAHFLAQTGHESGGFRVTTENLNYSAKGLQNIFKKYFTPESAAEYQRKPEKIANIVYANRMGNGNQASGEGYKFRGRGYLQVTGKSNYKKFSDFIGEDCVANPELVATKYPLASAGFFFESNKLWSICDLGSTDEVVKRLTKRINGGYNGLEDRLEKFKKYHNLLVG